MNDECSKSAAGVTLVMSNLFGGTCFYCISPIVLEMAGTLPHVVVLELDLVGYIK